MILDLQVKIRLFKVKQRTDSPAVRTPPSFPGCPYSTTATESSGCSEVALLPRKPWRDGEPAATHNSFSQSRRGDRRSWKQKRFSQCLINSRFSSHLNNAGMWPLTFVSWTGRRNLAQCPPCAAGPSRWCHQTSPTCREGGSEHGGTRLHRDEKKTKNCSTQDFMDLHVICWTILFKSNLNKLIR